MKSQMKRLFSFLLVLTIVMPCVRFAFAADTPTSGKCGKDAAWVLKDDTLTISGTGKMNNYESMECPWVSMRESIKRIVVEEGICNIGNWAFENCSQLKTVKLPGTLTSIGIGAFFFCWQLKKLTLPDGVKHIGDCAFDRCKTIKEMVFPDSVTIIGEGVMFQCSALERVAFPKGIQKIPMGMFGRCGSLTSITLPETITTICAGAFDNCGGLQTIVLPKNLQVIEDGAFLRTGLWKVTIPASVRKIGAEAFGMSFDLKKLTIMNPNCVIADDLSIDGWHLVPETTVLRGYAGSTTETYAKRYRLKFKSLGDSPVPTKLFGLKITTAKEVGCLKLT